jgi:dephospho-CoA kinase
MADDIVRNTGRVDDLREKVAELDAKYRRLAANS